MKQEHDIVSQVYRAKSDSRAADQLVKQYLPFIKAEAAKFVHFLSDAEKEDGLSIAMFAFHEAVLGYQRGKGAFLPFAAKAIRYRLIDYSRREKRHRGLISLSSHERAEDERTLEETLVIGEDDIEKFSEASAAKEEILEFSRVLSDYGLTLTEIADHCPKQDRTLRACHKALAYAKAHRELLDTLERTKKLPLSQLALGSGIEKKTLERHRKYMLAVLLAYTNGFEIIRGHLGQISVVKGGQAV